MLEMESLSLFSSIESSLKYSVNARIGIGGLPLLGDDDDDDDNDDDDDDDDITAAPPTAYPIFIISWGMDGEHAIVVRAVIVRAGTNPIVLFKL